MSPESVNQHSGHSEKRNGPKELSDGELWRLYSNRANSRAVDLDGVLARQGFQKDIQDALRHSQSNKTSNSKSRIALQLRLQFSGSVGRRMTSCSNLG
jgi:hypothetical protein